MQQNRFGAPPLTSTQPRVPFKDLLERMDNIQDGFPRLFEAQYADFVADLPLWLSLAKELDGPVLELGCGPGRVLLALAEAGFEAHGLDRNPAMLARAGRRLASSPAKEAELYLADLSSFSLDRSFSLAISPCNTLASLDEQEIAPALLCIHSHLVPGGLLAVDLPNSATALDTEYEPEAPLMSFLEPESGNPVQVYATRKIGSQRDLIRVMWAYDELLPDGHVRRLEIPEEYYLRSPDALRTLLANAGYLDIRMLGDYDHSPFEPDSPRMITLASVP